MFAKLIYENEIKKIFIDKENKSMKFLKKVVKEFTNLNEDEFLLYSVDLENKEIYINDDYSFEYIIESSKIKNKNNFFLEIKIKNIIENDTFDLITSEKSEINNKIENKILNSLDSFDKNSINSINFFNLKQNNNPNIINDDILENKIEDIKLKIKKELMDEIKNNLKEEIINEMKNELENKLKKKLKKQPFYNYNSNFEINDQFEFLTEKIKILEKNLNNMKTIINKNKSNILNKNNLKIYCNLCKKKIITENIYKCLICKNYDLCEECEVNNINQHNHIMIKIKDFNYKNYDELVLFFNNNFINNQKKNIFYTNIHNNIICNNCKIKPIQGNRFKCLICKDYDLCENCEGLNIHNYHNMLKIKLNEKLNYELIVDYCIKNSIN